MTASANAEMQVTFYWHCAPLTPQQCLSHVFTRVPLRYARHELKTDLFTFR